MRKSVVLALSAGVAVAGLLAPTAASAATGSLTKAGPSSNAHSSNAHSSNVHSSNTASSTSSNTPSATAPGAAANAAAGSDPDTTVTFSVTSGALTITAPAAASLGSGAPGGFITGVVGNVVVTDNRALLHAAWTATAASTNFTTGAGTGAEVIPAGDAAYDTGTIRTTGVITVTPSDIDLANAPQTVVAATNGTGNNTASWSPTISVSVPTSAVFGTYTGTLAHSVS
jgi:hypothetical protein